MRPFWTLRLKNQRMKRAVQSYSSISPYWFLISSWGDNLIGWCQNSQKNHIIRLSSSPWDDNISLSTRWLLCSDFVRSCPNAHIASHETDKLALSTPPLQPLQQNTSVQPRKFFFKPLCWTDTGNTLRRKGWQCLRQTYLCFYNCPDLWGCSSLRFPLFLSISLSVSFSVCWARHQAPRAPPLKRSQNNPLLDKFNSSHN